MTHRILVINPGSTSTEVALFEDETHRFQTRKDYDRKELSKYSDALEQYDMRVRGVAGILREEGVEPSTCSAVVSRGGLLKPMKSGTYRVTPEMVRDIRSGKVMSPHISNIAPLMAYEIAQAAHVPAFMADPVSVDEFEPLARISGIPEIERKALQHTLNIKAAARKVACETGKKLTDLNLIVAHLGGGISICPVKRGKIVDANNANEGGPFSPERAGGLPSLSLVSLCFSDQHSRDWIKRRLIGEGGIVAYLDTNRIEEVERRIEAGNKEACLVYEAMAYQISKEIGAMATVLKGEVDRIVLTGGCAHSKLLTGWIEERVSFIAPVRILPGADELATLAHAALRILRGEEMERVYR
jgi:butyrate kinase